MAIPSLRRLRFFVEEICNMPAYRMIHHHSFLGLGHTMSSMEKFGVRLSATYNMQLRCCLSTSSPQNLASTKAGALQKTAL